MKDRINDEEGGVGTDTEAAAGCSSDLVLGRLPRIKQAVKTKLWLMRNQVRLDGAVAGHNTAVVEQAVVVAVTSRRAGVVHLGRLEWVVWREVDVKEVYTSRVRRACVMRQLVEQCCDQQWRRHAAVCRSTKGAACSRRPTARRSHHLLLTRGAHDSRHPLVDIVPFRPGRTVAGRVQ